ncbi:MAG: hypothetical protein V4525_15835 [Pseudomonadota bacterium]
MNEQNINEEHKVIASDTSVEWLLDDSLEATFPASDPVAITTPESFAVPDIKPVFPK